MQNHACGRGERTLPLWHLHVTARDARNGKSTPYIVLHFLGSMRVWSPQAALRRFPPSENGAGKASVIRDPVIRNPASRKPRNDY